MHLSFPPTIRWTLLGAIICTSGCATIRKFNPLESKAVEARRLTKEAEAAIYESDYSNAESTLVSAIERDPTDNHSRALLADVLWTRGARKAAVEQMAKAVDLSERQDAAQISKLGEMLLTTGNHTAALHRADEAIALNPNSAEAWTLKGFTLKRLGQPKEALTAFFRSLSIRNEDSQTRAEIAKIYRQANQPQRALTILGAPDPEALQACRHFPEVCYLRGLLLRELERPTDAVVALQAARESGCEQGDLLFQLAECQLNAGQILQARATLADASQSCPENLRLALTELQQRVDEKLSVTDPVWR